MPDETNEGHYKPFAVVYGSETTDEHVPSTNENLRKNHGIPFSPVVQHAKNTGITISCAFCGKPRVVYSKQKSLSKRNLRIKNI